LSKVIRSEDIADCQAWPVPEVRSGADTGRGPMTARELEELHNQARVEGFEQGLKQGREAGSKEFMQRLELLDNAMHQLARPFEQLDEAVEQQLVQLAMLVARQLVRRELKADPAQVVAVVREALAALPVGARDVCLALNAEDAAMIRDVLSLQEGDHAIRVVEDPVQSRGGCRVLTETSQIDATVESRLNAVIANTLGGMRSTDSTES
jgi:flagellar assembly protein FliH